MPLAPAFRWVVAGIMSALLLSLEGGYESPLVSSSNVGSLHHTSVSGLPKPSLTQATPKVI